MADYTLTPLEDRPANTDYSLTPVDTGNVEVPPQPFLDRLARGDALNRAIAPYTAAIKGFGESFGSEPLGLSPEHVQQLREAGVYADPATGRGGALRFMNEAVGQQLSVLGDLAARGASGVVGAVAGAVRQFVQDSEGGLGNPQSAENEVKNLGNYMMLRGDHEFGRIDHGPGGATDTPIGILPREQDFKNAAAALGAEEIPQTTAEQIGERLGGVSHLRPIITQLARTYIEQGPEAGRAQLEEMAQAAPGTSGFYDEVRTPGFLDSLDRRITQATRSIPEQNLRDLWQERGIHPAEAVADAQNDAFLRGDLRSAVGAEVTHDMPSLDKEPRQAPGKLSAAIKTAVDNGLDIARDLQQMSSPMATGSNAAKAIAKDFSNALRRNRWDWSRADDFLEKNFSPESRERMWNASNEESEMQQEGKASEHIGIATLEPEERAAVEAEYARGQSAWLNAQDVGLVEGDGLPAYTPRMSINLAAGITGDRPIGPRRLPGQIGRNLRTTTPQLMHRQYFTVEETEAAAKALLGPEAKVVRDIRVLPLATSRLEDAVAGRRLINALKDYGERTGEKIVSSGAPPKDSPDKWFTVDHPAFQTWRPKFEEVDGKITPIMDSAGDPVFERVPMFVRDDVRGPLEAVLSKPNSDAYNAFMDLKGKTMGLIMYSPLIHNAVEFGRAFPAMPGRMMTFRVYRDGARVLDDVDTMHEAINSGMVPIGHRFFNQDITAIAEAPNLQPGRSLTAKVVGAIPGIFDEGAETATRRAIDKAGNFWHNTLLWDQVAKLQAGLYVNLRDDMLAKGVDKFTATHIAAHFANRYAGALPREAMSQNAQKISNMLMFSRTFTLGNLGAMKDMLTGLPQDVLAQIERDAGFKAGAIDEAFPGEEAVKIAKGYARRKAISMVALDIGLFYAGNSLLQSAFNVLGGSNDLTEEERKYVARFKSVAAEIEKNPARLLQPFHTLSELSATSENEPGHQDRVKVGYAKDGTAIYMRNPLGKIGEEFIGWGSGPLDMAKRKLGTVAKPFWQLFNNDAGFGHKIYDPDADSYGQYLANGAAIAELFFGAQVPSQAISAGHDLVKGEGDPKLNELQVLGPLAGLTFSKGAPGGPKVGEYYHDRAIHDFQVQSQIPDIRKQFLAGDQAGAQQRMQDLDIPPGLQRWYSKVWTNPSTRLSGRALRDFYFYATPEQRERFENAH